MAFELKEGYGNLFKNTRKKADNHPDYTGEVNVDGTVKQLAAWIKKGKNGAFMSLKVSDKQQKSEEPSKDFDGEIPF